MMSIMGEIDSIKTFGWSLWWHSHQYSWWRFPSVRDFYWSHIRPIFAPQHAELRASIPRTWSDLDHCISEFLYAAVISFVEKEDGIKDWEYQMSADVPGFDGGLRRQDQVQRLREVYEWAKTGRHAFQQRMNDVLTGLYPIVDGKIDLETDSPDSRAKHTTYWALEREFAQYEEKALQWIVASRGLMWT